MATMEHISRAILRMMCGATCALVQDLSEAEPGAGGDVQPETDDPQASAPRRSWRIPAQRTHQPAPAWTLQICPGGTTDLLEAAVHMRRRRDLCQDAAPEPLRRRRLYACRLII